MYRLQDGDTPVAPSAVATAMGVTPPTVTKTMQRMDEAGLVHYERYRGGRLSARGERIARDVLRYHRLLERYLTEHLGYDWAESHAEADALEHHLSEKLAARIEARLGGPADSRAGSRSVADRETANDSSAPSLACCDSGTVVVSAVRADDSVLRASLDEAGVRDGARLDVLDVAPCGMVTVGVESTHDRLSLPVDVAARISVSRPDGAAVGEMKRLEGTS